MNLSVYAYVISIDIAKMDLTHIYKFINMHIHNIYTYTHTTYNWGCTPDPLTLNNRVYYIKKIHSMKNNFAVQR